jgi:diacylglycerol O-acyltransferase
MTRKPLSNVDTAWLRMEDPTNLMMITGVIVFGAPMDFERLKATIEVGLLRFDRFRQRVVMPALPGGRLYWEDDPDFDLDYHLQRASLPPPGDQRTLQELASLLSSRQLDFSRPLWQFHLIEPYRDGCALICRLHHCIGDGLALVHVLLSLTETEPDTAWPMVELEASRRRRRRRMGRLCRPAAAALRTTGEVSRSLIREGWGAMVDPSRLVDAARIGARGTKSLARLLLLLPDARTVLKGPLGVPKRVAWSAPIPLQDVKAVGKGLGGTVNDLLLAATSGALRRYLEGRGEPVDGLNFRAVVPVNLRKPGTEHELGNKFGLVFLSLPVGVVDPIERLDELKRRMDALKDSLEAPVAFGILNTIGMTPEVIQDIVVNMFGLKGTAVMTNVIGPKELIYLAGAPLESLMFWVPQSGHLGMGVSIMSYNSQVRVGLITDAGLVPDPEAIVAGFDAEFDELVQVAQEAERARRAEGAPGPEDVVGRLGETFTALDAVLEDRDREPEAAPSETPERCQALTKAGKQCKNRPLSGSRYCWVHQEA